MKILAKSKNYQIISKDEDLWLRLNDSVSDPLRIGKFIGSPNDSLISNDEKYALIAGYGLMVVDLDGFFNNSNGLRKKFVNTYFRNSGQKFWINKVWQDMGFGNTTFCFHAQLKQYCINLKNETLIDFCNNNVKEIRRTVVV